MTKPTDTTVKTTREQQIISHQALGHLLAADLPAVNWSIDIIAPRQLPGQVDHRLPDTAKRAIVAQWAHFLGVDVQERIYPAGELYDRGMTVWALGKVKDVEVRVWCHVTPPPEDQAS